MRALGKPLNATITTRRLEVLEAKERAHDQYLRACRRMAHQLQLREQGGAQAAVGYRQALNDFDQAILAECGE